LPTIDDLIALRGYFTTIHHTPGRLRLSVDRGIVQNSGGITLEQISALPLHVKGLRELKLNKVAATATLLYDAAVIEPSLFDALLRGERIDEVRAIFHPTMKESV